MNEELEKTAILIAKLATEIFARTSLNFTVERSVDTAETIVKESFARARKIFATVPAPHVDAPPFPEIPPGATVQTILKSKFTFFSGGERYQIHCLFPDGDTFEGQVIYNARGNKFLAKCVSDPSKPEILVCTEV